MNYRKVFYWSITVALGGFLFGLDTAVISGCERTIQELWQLSDAMTGQMVAMALYGTIIGAVFGGLPAEKMGRSTSNVSNQILQSKLNSPPANGFGSFGCIGT